MQTLGLADSTPRTEGRLKALLWPTIRNDSDFDYITEQGFWVCFVVSTATLVFGLFTPAPFASAFEALFYFLAGVGVRQRNTWAAVAAFSGYLMEALLLQRYTGNGFGVVRVVFLALLLSNIRGIWLSSRWKKTSEFVPEPVRLDETLLDKLSDQLPSRIWPRVKWLFALVAAAELALLLFGLFAPMLTRIPDQHH